MPTLFSVLLFTCNMGLYEQLLIKFPFQSILNNQLGWFDKNIKATHRGLKLLRDLMKVKPLEFNFTTNLLCYTYINSIVVPFNSKQSFIKEIRDRVTLISEKKKGLTQLFLILR